MPLAPTPPVGANLTSNRRAAATRTDSDLAPSKWPLIASSAYTKLSRAGGAAPGDPELAGVNLKLVRLAHARNRLWSTLTAVQAAIRETNPQTAGGTPDAAVYNALRATHEKLEKAMLGFPLEVR